MARIHSTLTSLFTDIANAIRNKTGSNEVLVADAFPSAITAIPTGGGGDTDIEDGLVERTLSEYTNSRVSYVSSKAFTYFTGLTNVSFPACTSIGISAFDGCSNLLTAYFPVCTTVGEYAFRSCYRLESAYFPACKILYSNAFYSCHLRIAYFPSLQDIRQDAFEYCTFIQTASFPVCSKISGSAFKNCNKLTSIYFLGSSVPVLYSGNLFSLTPIVNSAYTGSFGSIIVMESMLEAFQTAGVWSNFSERFSVYNGTD